MTDTTITASAASVSLIEALHRRYEGADEELRRLEEAASASGGDTDHDERQLRKAIKTLAYELAACRDTILLQVPRTGAEAMILNFHIIAALDLADADGDQVSERDRCLLATATDTLFDFMCCTVDEDHQTIGKAFDEEARRVFFDRHRRNGILEV